jgi:hypothetical protein
MRWKCNNCEHLNEEKNFSCEVCDSQGPVLVNLAYKEYAESPETAFSLSWKFENADSITIDNGIGVVELKGECVVNIKKNTIFTLNASNRYAERKFQIKILLPKPVIEIFESDTSIIDLHKRVQFNWKVRNAEKVSISDFGEVTGLSSKEIKIKESKRITLIAENESGKVNKTIELTLPKPEILVFDASKYLITEGEYINLFWEVRNAEKININKVGKVDALEKGEIKTSPKESSKYVLIARNSSGEASQELKIEVEPMPIIEYFKSVSDVVLNGEKVQLNWKTKNISRVELFSGAEKIDVSKLNKYSFNLKKSTTFKLVAYGIRNLSEVTQIAKIKVIQNVKIERFEADRLLTIQSKPINLFWEVKNADVVKILPDIGDVPTNGSITINPEKKISYTIEATNRLTKISQSITIDVLPLPIISTMKLADVPKFDLVSPKLSLFANPLFSTVQDRKTNIWGRIFSKRQTNNRAIKIAFIEFRYPSGHVEIEHSSPFYLFKNILNQSQFNFKTLFSSIRKKLKSKS